MGRPRRQTNAPERNTEEFFRLEDVPTSWLSLPTSPKEARDAGVKWYFTSRPCQKRGHFSVRLASNMSCNACAHIRHNTPEYKEKRDVWQRDNQERINSTYRARRADPNDSFSELESARSKRYRDKDIEATRERGRSNARRRYYQDPEAARAYARAQSQIPAYKIKRNATLAQKRKEDPAFLIEQRLRCRIRSVMRRQVIPKTGSTKGYLGLSDFTQLKEYIENQFTQGMSWDNLGDWHLDHIRPCASFDLTQALQQQACFYWANLQPLSGDENLFKGGKWNPQMESEWAEHMRDHGYEGDLFLVFPDSEQQAA